MCLGCVVRVELNGQDSMTSLWTSPVKGCNLSILYVRYVWPIHVSRVDPGEEALHGTSP
jgi:hypothetical protein